MLTIVHFLYEITRNVHSQKIPVSRNLCFFFCLCKIYLLKRDRGGDEAYGNPCPLMREYKANITGGGINFGITTVPHFSLKVSLELAKSVTVLTAS